MSFYAGQSREALRQSYREAWRKWRERLPLQPVEMQIADVINAHPEYQRLLESESALGHEYLPEGGRENPFLHMGLHLALREQLRTDRPAGIRALHQRLLASGDEPHDIEHRMIEVLAATLWEAQRNHATPDEQLYLRRLLALGR